MMVYKSSYKLCSYSQNKGGDELFPSQGDMATCTVYVTVYDFLNDTDTIN